MANLRTAIAAVLAMVSYGALAVERVATPVPFMVEAQSLPMALNEWAQQAGLQVVWQPDVSSRQMVAPRVAGTLDAEAALKLLLQGSGLTYSFVDAHTVAIRHEAPSPPEGNIAAGTTVRPLIRLAQAEQPQSSANARFSGGMASQAEQSSVQKPAASSTELSEIIVTGSRLRTHDAAQAPVTVFDRAKIESLGASTVPELLKYLPQQSYNRGEAVNRGGAQFVELRGLGVASTLVLVNGRRTVASATNLNMNAFDLNSIPLAVVERVEVLSDSASAVYGADALGGVLNVILKEQIPEPVLNLGYGAAEGGADEVRTSFSAGFGGERFKTSVVVDYFDRNELLGGERDRWSNQDHSRFGGPDNRDTISNPGTVYSLTGDNLPGLPSPVAGAPAGITGAPSIADFAATAGQENKDSLLRYWSIMPDYERRSAAVFSNLEITANVAAFAELLHSEGDVSIAFEPPSLFFEFVPETNAFNPFGEPVLVNYLFTELPQRRQTFESQMDRAVLGLNGAMAQWDWEMSVLHTTEDAEEHLIGGLNPVAVAQALASSNPSQALNVFSSGSAGSDALLQSLINVVPPSEYTSRGTQASAMLRGSLLSLPAGAAELVFGSEWRQEGMHYRDLVTIDEGREAYATFAELLLPLVSSDWGIAGLNALSFTVAARYDHYSDFGGTTNPQYAIAWKPVQELSFRVAYGTGFRAPSLFELYRPGSQFPFTITDPRRAENGLVTLMTGGNRDLDPIESRSYSAGVTFRQVDSPLTASLNYWRIRLEDRIAAFSPQILLANEELFPERVVRANPTSADLATGRPGVVQSINVSQVNFGELDTYGVDLSISYSMEFAFGRVTPSLASTWVGKYSSADVPGQPPADRLGIASFVGTIPKLKAVGSLEWSRNGITAGVNGRYTSSYDDAAFFGGPTGRTVPSQTLVDVQGSVDLGVAFAQSVGWMDALEISAGVWNVFDKEPPFSEVNALNGYDGSQGDLRQRFGYIRLSKSF